MSSLEPFYPLYLANRPCETARRLTVYNKYTDAEATQVALAGRDDLQDAIAAGAAAEPAMRALPAYQRREILAHCARRFGEMQSELATALCIEAGKPIKDARGEVARLIDTFRVAAEEATRMKGEVFPLDISPRAQGYSGMWKRVPAGLCGLISPFNFPLNLSAHKIAPAIAAGCPFVLKPASYTPVGALLIGRVLAETSLPPGAFSIMPATRVDGDLIATDERIKVLSFTGSPRVGWDLKSRAGRKKVVLELGGNAACVIDADMAPHLDDVIPRVITGAFYQSGQSCISVQRILIHESIYAAARDRLVAAANQLRVGDPMDEATFIGPVIAEDEAIRIERWIAQAEAAGARRLCGGSRNGPMMTPALLEHVPKDQPLYCDEVFGPVAVLLPFKTFDEALHEVNNSVYGLQAGVFTRDLYKAQLAWDTLEVGGVIVGDVPSWRVDHMPYGGVKHSGLGREGLRFAIEEMTEIRMLAIRNHPPGGAA